MSSAARTSRKADRVGSRTVMTQRERMIGLTGRIIVLLIAIAFALFPVIFIVSSAFNPEGTLSTRSLIPNTVDTVFALFRNTGEDFSDWPDPGPTAGEYSLSVSLYRARDASQQIEDPTVINFTLIDDESAAGTADNGEATGDAATEPSVTVTLINSETDQPIPEFDPIPDGAVINLAEVGTNLNFRANPQVSGVDSVRFELSGEQSVARTENYNTLVSNFEALLIDELNIFPFWNWLANSLFVATTTTILSVLITALAAYSFSRFRFNGRKSLLLGVLLIQVFPNLLALVALFLILQQIGRLSDVIPQAVPALSFVDFGVLELFGLNSLGGLILVYLGGVMGVNTWLMKGFFDSIPRDIDESAKVDGATSWQIFWQLIMPLVRPILAIVAVLSFVGTFNEFVLARILLRDQENWTLMVGLFEFVNADFNRDWGKFAAGSLIAATPVVILYLALQDQIVGGLTQGAVKG